MPDSIADMIRKVSARAIVIPVGAVELTKPEYQDGDSRPFLIDPATGGLLVRLASEGGVATNPATETTLASVNAAVTAIANNVGGQLALEASIQTGLTISQAISDGTSILVASFETLLTERLPAALHPVDGGLLVHVAGGTITTTPSAGYTAAIIPAQNASAEVVRIVPTGTQRPDKSIAVVAASHQRTPNGGQTPEPVKLVVAGQASLSYLRVRYEGTGSNYITIHDHGSTTGLTSDTMVGWGYPVGTNARDFSIPLYHPWPFANGVVVAVSSTYLTYTAVEQGCVAFGSWSTG